MKILRIGGENLASLEGQFAVDFTEGPLGHAGLFAITGPTGAGKTTLLDALCLALFGTTPRAQAVPGRGYEVGRKEEENRLSSSDARNILRRGAAKGFAEVDFLGKDGKRYRARWSVRRAHLRPGGKLQTAQQELFDENETAIGRTQGEVLAAIRARVGLDYDQFCRSVLLAQGEFAAFLRADEKKRAELLEAVTGTAIYREISRKAHARFAEAKAGLELLEREHLAMPVLDGEARQALEAEREGHGRALEAATLQVEAAAATLRWFERLEALLAAEHAGEAALAAAEAARVEAAPVREALLAVQEVDDLRVLLDRVDEATARREQAGVTLGGAREAAADCEADAAAARVEAEALVATERAAAAAREAAAPLLQEAAALDGRVVDAARSVQEAEEGVARLRGRAGEHRARLEELVAEEAARLAQVAADDAWLEAHRAWGPVAAQWERWEAALEQVAAQAREQAGKERELAQLEAGAAASAVALEEAGRVEGAAAQALAAARAELDAAEGARPGEGRQAIRARWAALQAEVARGRACERLAADAAGAREAAAQAAADAAAARAEAERLGGTRRELAAQRLRLETEAAVAGEALRDATAVQDLEARRSELVPGKPCPLCGAEAHPWAEQVPPAAGMVTRWQARVGQLHDDLAKLERADAQAAARIEGEEARANRGAADAIRHRERLADLQASWAAARGEVSALPEEAADGAAAVAAWLEGLAQAEGELRLLEEALDAAEARIGRAAAGVEKARADWERAREAKLRLEAALQEQSRSCRDTAQQLARIRDDAARRLAELSGAFDGVEGWRREVQADPAAFAERAAAAVASLRQRTARREEALHRLDRDAAAKEAISNQLREAEQAVAEAAATLAGRARTLAGLREKRGSLLGGEAVEKVEARLRRATEAAFAAREAGDRRVQAALAAATAAAARREAAQAELAREGAAAEERTAELVAAASARGLEVAEVRRRLACSRAELAGWREQVEAVDTSCASAASVLQERRRQREAHEASCRPAADETAARAQLEAAEAARKETEARFHGCVAALRRDDEARARSAAFLPRLEAARRDRDRWEKMHGLIGSASGDRFQLFAQSLTLDVLLVYANAHLEELAPRYRLERAPASNLELQVIDRDLGDEVRSVSSLSGGETFLASLALALGLSALSSRSAPVESLFVDEGFGTLDPQTLDMALATLDALQAAGRKVGLISHVQGMAERIGVQVRVEPRGSGSSRVVVVGP